MLYRLAPNKPSGSLLEISPKTFNSEFQEIKIWLTGRNSKSLEVKNKLNLILIIK